MALAPSKWDPDFHPLANVGKDGLDISQPPEALDETASPALLNVVYVQNILQVDSGVKPFRGVVEGIPQGVFQFFLTDGASYTLLATTTTLYVDSPEVGEWQYVGDGTTADLTAQANATDTIITVDDTTGLVAGRRVGLLLDNGLQHRTTIASITDATHFVLTAAIPAGRHSASGTHVTQTRDLQGTTEFQVVGVPWSPNNWLIFSNGVDLVMYFDGVDLLVLGGLAAINLTSARVVQVFHSHLLLMDVTENGDRLPQRVRRCDAGNPEQWVTGLAGKDDLVDTDDWILSANPLGPWMIIVRENTVMRMSYVGTLEQLFFFEYALLGTGGICPSCVAETGSSLVVFSTSGAVRYAGGYDVETVGEQIFNYTFSQVGNLNVPVKDLSFTVYISELDEVWFFYASQGSEFPDTLLRYNQGDESWFVRKLGIKFLGYGFFLSESSTSWQNLIGSWEEQRFKWNSKVFQANSPVTLFCGAEDNQVYQYDYLSPTDNGLPIEWFWESKDFFKPNILLTLDGVVAFGRGNGVLVEVSVDRGQSWTPLGSFNFGLTSSRQHLDRQITGPYLRFRFSGSDPLFQLSWFAPRYYEHAQW